MAAVHLTHEVSLNKSINIILVLVCQCVYTKKSSATQYNCSAPLSPIPRRLAIFPSQYDNGLQNEKSLATAKLQNESKHSGLQKLKKCAGAIMLP